MRPIKFHHKRFQSIKRAIKAKNRRFAKMTRDRRLTMIMENLISNKGKFDPTRGAHKQ